MDGMDLSGLTPEQLDSLSREVLRVRREKEQRGRDERRAYKVIASDIVEESIPKLLAVSAELMRVKREVYGDFATALNLKRELYRTPDGQYNNTFSNLGQTFRIRLGDRLTDSYDDTANEGIEIVKGYIASLASDEKTGRLVGLVMRLLSRDQKGSLKASRILQLGKLADESGDERFIDGVRIIRDAYRPQQSKTFITAERRDEHGVWHPIPLSVTEV